MEKQEGQPYALSGGELRALQNVLLEMLAELDRICKKNGIQYYLDGGTLLGAVRHKGFIPWDDDLDVVMLRSEYERLRAACRQDLNATKYFFQDNTTDPEYRWGYARIRRKNSAFVRLGQEHLKMQTGIFLDIFLRDNVPDFYPRRLLNCFYAFFLRKVLYSEVGKVNARGGFLRGIYALLNKIPPPFAFRRLERLAAKWNARPAQYTRCLAFHYVSSHGYRFQLGFDRRWFTEEPVMLEFEGRSFPAVRDYDGYLKCLYGDYMTLPPPEKRHWHPAAVFRLPPGTEEVEP